MGNGRFCCGLLVHEPLDRPALDDVFLDDLGDIFGLHVLVKRSFRIHDNDGACSAEPVTAGFYHGYFAGEILCRQFLYNSFMDFSTARGMAPCAAADKYMCAKDLHLRPPFFSCSVPLAMTKSICTSPFMTWRLKICLALFEVRYS